MNRSFTLPTKSAILLATTLTAACSGFQPETLGIRDDRLAPCPSSPNCVSSFDTDETHHIAPFRLASGQTNSGQVMTKAAQTIKAMPRTKIVTQTDRYLHAEFTSLLMRYVDDLELVLDTDHQLLHVKSASRLGYSDWGVNRKRIDGLKTELVRQGIVLP